MRTRQLASLIVMMLYLAGCTTWQVQPVAPQQLLEKDPPSKVRVLTKHNQKLVFKDPSVLDGALWGHVDGSPTRISLDEIAHVEKKQLNPGNTVFLGVAIVAWLAIGIAYHDAMSSSGW
jgi:hypothetical protein